MFKTLLLLSVLFISAVYSANEYARATLQPVGSSGISGLSASFAYNGDGDAFILVSNPNAADYVYAILNHGDLTKTPSYSDIFNPNNNKCNSPGFVGQSGAANPTFTNYEILLSTTDSVVGLAFAVFTGVDDSCNTQQLRSVDSVNAVGSAVAWGVIAIGNTNMTTVPASAPFTSLSGTTPSGAFNPTPTDTKYTATCSLVETPKAANPISGTVYFATNGDSSSITITAQISGLVKGSTHGVHIHQYGDLSVFETSVGGHWKIANQTHGLPNNSSREYGDLGNICTYSGSTAYYKYTTNYFPLEGDNNILGKAFVVHELRDNGTTFGTRIAWCTIGVRPSANAAPFNVPSSLNIASPPICDPSATTSTTTTGGDESSTGFIVQSSAIILIFAALLVLLF